MEISVTQQKHFQVVAPHGHLDALTAPGFESELGELLDQDCRALILNMEHLDFVSSAGLRAILSIAKRMRGLGGELRFAGLRPAVQEVFTISGFTSLFPIFPDVEQAIA